MHGWVLLAECVKLSLFVRYRARSSFPRRYRVVSCQQLSAGSYSSREPTNKLAGAYEQPSGLCVALSQSVLISAFELTGIEVVGTASSQRPHAPNGII